MTGKKIVKRNNTLLKKLDQKLAKINRGGRKEESVDKLLIDLEKNFKEKNYTKAIKIAEKIISLEKNNSTPYHYLDVMYFNLKDYEKSFLYGKKAADLGSIGSACNTALNYSNGDGVKQDYKEAIRYYQLAIDNSKKSGKVHSQALYNLSTYYLQGKGVVVDYRKGLELREEAANAGLTEAQLRLGESYMYGENGVTQDFTKAIYWLKKAVDLNEPRAKYMLGQIYITNNNEDDGLQLIREASKQNVPQATNYLNKYY